jgi:hypothetical protein
MADNLNNGTKSLATPSEAETFENAYGRLKDELAAIAAEDLQSVKLDIPSAVTTTFGVLPQVRALRAQMQKELPAFDLEQFDKLEDYALALSYAHSHYLTALQPTDDLAQLSEDGMVLRSLLAGDAQQLSTRGLILGNQLSQLKGGSGYKNLALDLQILSNVLKENWDKIQGKCATVAGELARADSLAASLMRVVGGREQGPGLVAAATDVRLRAYTAFIRAYQQTQRAVTYLRHGEGDADSMVPSLFVKQARKKPDQPVPPEPVNPVASTPTEGAPAAPAAAATGTSEPIANASASVTKHPFLS